MKISFMTFMCPEWTAEQVIAGAVKYGYDGIEWRVASRHKHGVEVGASSDSLALIRRQLADAGVESACVATSCTFAGAVGENRQKAIDSARRHIELAASVAAPRIRVFGGSFPDEISREEANKNVAEALAALDSFAAAHKVKICLETHDSFRSGAIVAEVLKKANGKSLACCWDHMHPYRAGEEPEVTRDFILKFTDHCHVHDGKRAGGPLIAPGTGDIPICKIMGYLKYIGYKGYFSAEYWAELGPPDTGLPLYANTMRKWIKELV